MPSQNEISEYIDNLSLKKSFCKGYRADDVYEAICNICTMYNQILSDAYTENDDLKQRLMFLESSPLIGNHQNIDPVKEDEQIINSLDLFIEEKETDHMDQVYMDIEKIGTEEGISDKELQRLKRGELLEILLDQSRENESLKIQLEEKNKMIDELSFKLENRKIELKNAGSIAEASFKLNGVFEAAEKAAEQYLENLQELYEREQYMASKKEVEIERQCSMLLQAAKERCDFMKEETIKRCEDMEASVRKQCEELMLATEIKCKSREKESEERCISLDQKAKSDVDQRWEDLSKRLEDFYTAHEGLKDLLKSSRVL